MADDTIKGMAGAYMAAKQARQAGASWFDSALQGVLSGPAVEAAAADPLFSLRKQMVQQQVESGALKLSGAVMERKWELEDAQKFQEAASEFTNLPTEKKVNYQPPAFKTPQSQSQWLNFSRLVLGTEQVQQLEQINAATNTAIANDLKMVAEDDPYAASMIQSMTDPQKKLQALQLAADTVKAKQAAKKQEDEILKSDLRIAEIAARSEGQKEVQKERNIGMLERANTVAAAQVKLKELGFTGINMRERLTRNQFINRHLNEYLKRHADAAVTEKQAINELSTIFDTQIAPFQPGTEPGAAFSPTNASPTPTVTPNAGRRLKYDPATGQLQGSGS